MQISKPESLLRKGDANAYAPIQLTDDAYAILETVFYDTERRLQTDLADIPDWAGKYVGAVLRIAGLLHVAENPELTDFEELSAETMQNAVQIGEYFIAHAKAAFSLIADLAALHKDDRMMPILPRRRRCQPIQRFCADSL